SVVVVRGFWDRLRVTVLLSCSLVVPRPPCSTLFPYTTLFRSRGDGLLGRAHRRSRPCRPRGGGGYRNAKGGSRDVVSIHRSRHADRKSTRLNSSHVKISYADFCLKKKTCHLAVHDEPHPRLMP